MISLIAVVCGCSSHKFPSEDDSMRKYDLFLDKTDSLSRLIKSKNNITNLIQVLNQDIRLTADIGFINKLSSGIANQREDDLKLNFYSKQNFMKEEKSVLGINYTNSLNIDTGFVSINLKKFNFKSINNNKINSLIELEGKGFLKASGKYTAIPASASPDVDIYLYEPVSFVVKPDKTGNIAIYPEHKSLMLRTKFYINLLEWKVPYYQEIPLELTDMIQPILLPLTFGSQLSLPLPAQKFGKNNIEFGHFDFKLTDQKVSTVNNKIVFTATMSLKRKS